MLWIAALVCTQPSVAVVDFTDPRDADKREAWLPIRAADLIALRLSGLGIAVRDRRFAVPSTDLKASGLSAEVTGRARPSNVGSATERIEINLHVRTADGKKRLSRAGPGSELDRMTAELALAVAKAVGVTIPKDSQPLLTALAAHPFEVHRRLGRAERRLEAGQLLQATVAFDQAGTFGKRGLIPEAVEGRARATEAKSALSDKPFGAKQELALAAEERALVALRANRTDEARRGLADLLKYTTERALRWNAPLHLGGPQRAVVGGDRRWRVQTAAGPSGLFTLHPPTGHILAVDAGVPGLVGATEDHLLTLKGRILRRLQIDGQPMWKVALPLPPIEAGWERVLFAQGSLGVRSSRGVAWVEVGLGGLGQVATGVKPLAQASVGLLVDLGAKSQVGLLRPGKKTPAWRSEVGRPIEGAALTSERALILSGPKLEILRTHNGKQTRSLKVPIGSQIIRADGRYACLAGSDQTVILIDVLSAEKTAALIGPGRPVDCLSSSDSVAILYATGDLIFFGRDGKMLDRGRVFGVPERLLAGSPIAPGPVVVTDQGLFAFADLSSGARRDTAAMVRLAALEAEQGNPAAALRLVDHVALRSAGSVAKAEMLRAKLLKRMEGPAYRRAADAATRRCKAAERPEKPLPVFSLSN